LLIKLSVVIEQLKENTSLLNRSEYKVSLQSSTVWQKN